MKAFVALLILALLPAVRAEDQWMRLTQPAKGVFRDGLLITIELEKGDALPVRYVNSWTYATEAERKALPNCRKLASVFIANVEFLLPADHFEATSATERDRKLFAGLQEDYRAHYAEELARYQAEKAAPKERIEARREERKRKAAESAQWQLLNDVRKIRRALER